MHTIERWEKIYGGENILGSCEMPFKTREKCSQVSLNGNYLTGARRQ